MKPRTPEEWRELLGPKVASMTDQQLREFSARVRDFSTMLARIAHHHDSADDGPRLIGTEVAG